MPDIPNVIYAVLGFGFIIFIHELGHFLAAKLFGVKVKAFSLGFPPTILHKRFGDTDYRIGAIPMGGYVSMLGDDPREPSGDPRALRNILPWRQAVIFMAGVSLNIVTAMIIYVTASVVGIEVVEPVVGQAVEGKPALLAGLRAGDRIRTIDGVKVNSFNDIRVLTLVSGLNNPGRKFEVEYQRDGRVLRTSLAPTISSETEGLPTLGIASPLLPIVKKIEPKSPADQAGLKPGDRIVAINGKPTPFFYDCKEMLEVWPEQPVTLTVKRPDKPLEDGDDDAAVAYKQIDIKVDPATITVPDYGLEPPLTIREVLKGKPAEKAGLKKGDCIVRAGRQDYPSWRFFSNLIRKSDGKPVRLVVRREGRDQPLEVSVRPERESEQQRYLVGVLFNPWIVDVDEDVVLKRLGNPGPAHKAGIPEGATISGLNGKGIKTWRRLMEELYKLKGKPAKIKYTEPGSDQEKTATVTPARTTAESLLSGAAFTRQMTAELAPIYNPLKALNIGLTRIRRLAVIQYVSIKAMVNGQLPTKEVSGPMRIGVIFYEASKMGWGKFMELLGLISVAIALLNAMPIPPLDGGHVMFLAVEKILRRPLPLRVRSIVTVAGTVLLLSFVAFAFYNDSGWLNKTFFY
ncbi:MAG: RIP metalloprotease RseP [Anaerolineaceae bacterium]|nr:RIP metalloprotease RseP [Anaerolineaceae bacterium]